MGAVLPTGLQSPVKGCLSLNNTPKEKHLLQQQAPGSLLAVQLRTSVFVTALSWCDW